MRRNIRVTPDGTRDLLFEECNARRQVEQKLSRLFQLRGFSEAMTPGIEFYDLFDSGNPVIPAEKMYKMTDYKGRLLVMRPDSTLPIARLVATRLRQAPLPIRLYYTQDVFYQNHSLSGRNDQEFQAGVELIGCKGDKSDIEVLALAAESLKICNAGDFRLEIGHVGFVMSLVEEIDENPDVQDLIKLHIENKNYAALGSLLDTLKPSSTAQFLRNLPRLFGGKEVLSAAAPLCTNPQAREALDYLNMVYGKLCDLGLSNHVIIDLGMVHKNEYYTGVIFRGFIEGSGDVVISGGRYDTLLQRFGCDLPATGFGVNVDSITKIKLARNEVKPPLPPEFLVHAESGFETEALKRIEELIQDGVCSEFSVFSSLEEARDYAVKRKIPKILIISDTEKIIDLNSGEML
ncbi:MAG TPA: ATP phosphoribosyltransferase regulatory subunit [Clostridiales bacterium]|nr:ATP phosphoribosyltransferase regulatory subunit [Clostridiales bacterium]